jgi:hypothetical protein
VTVIVANLLTEALRDLWGPGLVFLVLCGWLVRRVLRAARNESILEEQRLRAALGDFTETDPRKNAANAPTSSSPELQAPPAADAPAGSSWEEAPAANELSNVTPFPGASTAEARTAPVDVPPRLGGADVRGALPEHLAALAQLIVEREAVAGVRRCEVLWVRSTDTHVAWGERRPGQRELICVAQVDDGKIVARWQYG